MKKLLFTIGISIIIIGGCATTQAPVIKETELASEMQKSSYAQGVKHMQGLRQYSTDLDQDAFLLGMNDVLNNKPLRLRPKELQAGLDWVFIQQVLYNDKVAPLNLAKGKAFMEANRQTPGVKALASGLQYKVLAQGTGGHKLGINDIISVRYRIKRINDDELTESGKDSKAPTEIIVKDVIKGWQEALLLMSEGDKWQLYIPPQLAYGEAGIPSVGLEPNETLIYEVEIIRIKPPPNNNAK